MFQNPQFYGMAPLGRMGQLGEGDQRNMRKEAIMQQIMGTGSPQAVSPGQGAVQGLNSVLGGLAMRQHNQGAFPEMPGGGQPGFAQAFRNLFGSNGGLF